MPRIAVLDDYWHIAEKAADWASLPGSGVTFFHDTLKDPDALVARLKPFDAIVTTRERTRLPRTVLERLDNLKVIAGTGARQANVDMDAANELGIIVLITQGGPSRGNATAELAWALVLGVTRNIAWEDRQMRDGKWQTRPAEGLGGKTMGILGLGRLGTRVSEYANFFDMDVIAWGPTLDAERAKRRNVEYVSWGDLFRRSDILSIHVPLTDMSRGWITAKELGLMKPTAFLVNTSRGPIVEEKALIDALRQKKIAGAALDVYDEEPISPDNPLLKLENTLLAPHLGYSTVSTIKSFMVESVKNLGAWIDGSPINVYNPEALPGRS
jgi:phosphoglycerate dehydrogenase-like enzyme